MKNPIEVTSLVVIKSDLFLHPTTVLPQCELTQHFSKASAKRKFEIIIAVKAHIAGKPTNSVINYPELK